MQGHVWVSRWTDDLDSRIPLRSLNLASFDLGVDIQRSSNRCKSIHAQRVVPFIH